MAQRFATMLVTLAAISVLIFVIINLPRRLGGITGDVLGASNEINEALVLILVTMVY
jgi:cobalamin synthase